MDILKKALEAAERELDRADIMRDPGSCIGEFEDVCLAVVEIVKRCIEIDANGGACISIEEISKIVNSNIGIF